MQGADDEADRLRRQAQKINDTKAKQLKRVAVRRRGTKGRLSKEQQQEQEEEQQQQQHGQGEAAATAAQHVAAAAQPTHVAGEQQ
jgi:hypothetical protein